MSNQKNLDRFIEEGRLPLNRSYQCYIPAEGDSWFNLGFLPTPAKPDATGNSNDWKNEIPPPNAGGYKKLAQTHIQPLIDQILTWP